MDIRIVIAIVAGIMFLAAAVLEYIETAHIERALDRVIDDLSSLSVKVAELENAAKVREACAKSEKELVEARIESIHHQIDVLKVTVDELPVEELNNTVIQEKQYLEGIQNIFNYGGEIPKVSYMEGDK